jgi:hypothetical protein
VATKPEDKGGKDVPSQGGNDTGAEGSGSKPLKGSAEGSEGVRPRFKRGSDDLRQLEGIEKQQRRSRKAKRRQHKKARNGPEPGKTFPVIDQIKKSERRVKNRFRNIRNFGDAIDEFGS